jgi:hypothetical protein
MIYDMVMEEMHSRKAYKYETYVPFYTISYAVHAFNLMNNKRKIYYEGKKILNSRLPILFVSPAGFMKSYYLTNMAGDPDVGVFNNSGFKVGYEQSMTEAGLVGTIGKDGFGEPRFIPGAAAVYNEGMMLIDEFSGITQAMKSSGNNQMDSQLLTILDGGHVVKRLASGMHEYDTRLTLWTGVQPAKIDMSSGLGRRFCYMLFMPTRHDNKMIMKARHDAKNIRPDPTEMLKIQNMNKSFVASMNTIERIEYPNEILSLYESMGIFSFEAQLYDQLILGYNLAKFGAKKKMELTINDELRTLLTREKEWRLEINLGVDLGLMKNMIKILGGKTNTQMLAAECTMVGWNAEQMNSVLNDMVRYNMICRVGNKVELAK